MNTSVGTSPLVLFQYPGDHERTRIRMIRYVGFFLTWQSVPILHQVPLNLNSKLVTPKSENCWNSMFWTVQSKQRQRQYHRTVRSLAGLRIPRRQFLMSAKTLSSKTLSIIEEPEVVSWIRKYGGERFSRTGERAPGILLFTNQFHYSFQCLSFIGLKKCFSASIGGQYLSRCFRGLLIRNFFNWCSFFYLFS